MPAIQQQIEIETNLLIFFDGLAHACMSFLGLDDGGVESGGLSVSVGKFLIGLRDRARRCKGNPTAMVQCILEDCLVTTQNGSNKYEEIVSTVYDRARWQLKPNKGAQRRAVCEARLRTTLDN